MAQCYSHLMIQASPTVKARPPLSRGPRLMIGLACLGLGGFVAGTPTPSRASGSVDVTMATKTYTVSVAQTFRKMLPAGTKDYYPRIRKNFQAKISALAPALGAFINGPARKRVKTLGSGGLTLVVKRCKTTTCDLDKVTFPALVELPEILMKNNNRTAYTLALPFNARPTNGDIVWLTGKMQSLVDAHGSAHIGKGAADPADKATKKPPAIEMVKLVPVIITERDYEVRTESFTLVYKPDAPYFQAALKRLANASAGVVRPVIRKAEGVTFGRLKKNRGLKAYDRRHGLPALLSATKYAGQKHQITVNVVVEAADDEESVRSFSKALEAVIRK